MASKRFEETKIAKKAPLVDVNEIPLDELDKFACCVCKHEFWYENVGPSEEPKFCPHCGRRNSDA